MPYEIINLIVGLSIRHFPKELDNVILGIPYTLSNKDAQLLFEKNLHKKSEISTNNGRASIGIVTVK